MTNNFSLERTTIQINNLIPIGKFIISFDKVNRNAKWKLSVRDLTKGPLHIPFSLTKECQDEFQNALKKAGTDVLMIKQYGVPHFYTFAGSTIAEIGHPLLDRYVECMEQGVIYP